MAMETTTDDTAAMARQNATLTALNRLLRGEISAVETYRQALEKIDDPDLRVPLDECLESHEGRAAILRDRIVSMGGEPAEGSGAWGGFARLIETGASVLGIRAALAALEEG